MRKYIWLSGFSNKKMVSLLTFFQGAKSDGTKFNGNEGFINYSREEKNGSFNNLDYKHIVVL